jgi:hypothetical protein
MRTYGEFFVGLEKSGAALEQFFKDNRTTAIRIFASLLSVDDFDLNNLSHKQEEELLAIISSQHEKYLINKKRGFSRASAPDDIFKLIKASGKSAQAFYNSLDDDSKIVLEQALLSISEDDVEFNADELAKLYQAYLNPNIDELIASKNFAKLYELLRDDRINPSKIAEVCRLDRLSQRQDRFKLEYNMLGDGQKPYVQTFLDYCAFEVASVDKAIELFKKVEQHLNPFEFKARMQLKDGAVDAPSDVLLNLARQAKGNKPKKLLTAFTGLYPEEKKAAPIEVDTHGTSIHTSVDISALNLFKGYIVHSEKPSKGSKDMA